MAGLPEELVTCCYEVLASCREFKNQDDLRAVFVTEELANYKDDLPEGRSPQQRILLTVDHLLHSRGLSDGRPVLPLFIAALRNLYPQEDPLRDHLESLRIELQRQLCPGRSSGSLSVRAIPPAYEAAMLSNFDLDEIVDDYLDGVYGKHGLVGLLIPCHSPTLLNLLCERLKRELFEKRANQVCLKPTLSLRPIYNVEPAISTIRKYQPMLQERDVLVAVQDNGYNMLADFWRQLCCAVQGQKWPNRLIVIIAPEESVSIEGVLPLHCPSFRTAHVLRWVGRVIQSLAWPEYLIQTWADQMIAECSHENKLHIDWVYGHLGEMLDLLQQKPTLERFQQELAKRRQLYVQTPD